MNLSIFSEHPSSHFSHVESERSDDETLGMIAGGGRTFNFCHDGRSFFCKDDFAGCVETPQNDRLCGDGNYFLTIPRGGGGRGGNLCDRGCCMTAGNDSLPVPCCRNEQGHMVPCD